MNKHEKQYVEEVILQAMKNDALNDGKGLTFESHLAIMGGEFKAAYPKKLKHIDKDMFEDLLVHLQSYDHVDEIKDHGIGYMRRKIIHYQEVTKPLNEKLDIILS